MTDKEMEAIYGENWDDQPHGGRNDAFPDGCECDTCTAWHEHIAAWLKVNIPACECIGTNWGRCNPCQVWSNNYHARLNAK